MPPSNPILTYQQHCHREYNASIGLPPVYTYPDGNPIRPLPSSTAAAGGLMIVGAYPSARFESRPSQSNPGRNRLIPVADNLQPFGDEAYFDGVRVRRLESAYGLRHYLLEPLGLTPDECWITDLVKVFLYKPEHVDSIGDVLPDFPVPQLRRSFRLLGEKSLPWLQEECRLCKPHLVIALGEEVAQIVSSERTAKADDLLNRPVSVYEGTGQYPTLHLPHPDACRRSEKWRQNLSERLEIVKELMGHPV